MKRSYLTNLLLLTLMMVLLWQLDRVETPEVVTTIGGELTPSMVQTITIARGQQNNIELTRSNLGWQIQQPFTAQASDSRINMLLSLLDTAAGEQFYIDNDMDLSQFGLAEPAISLTFNDTRFEFGDIETLSEQRYLRAGEIIYLFNDSISPLLQASASGFIENRLFAGSDQLQSLTVPLREQQMLQNQSLTLHRQNGQWQSDYAGFSTDQLTAIASAWQPAYAMQVSPANVVPGEDFLPVQFTFDNGRSIDAFARLSPQGLSVLMPERQLQYQFPASTAMNLFPDTTSPGETD